MMEPDESEETSIATKNPGSTTDTDTSTPTSTATPTVAPTRSTETTHLAKQRMFTTNYTNAMEENGVNVTNAAVDGENETLYLTYRMRNPESNLYTGRERENVSLMYTAMIEGYVENGFDQRWIPKQVNVTAKAPNGRLYETAYTTFGRAKQMIDDEISAKRYLLEYYGTIEEGPANPEYDGK